MPWVPLPPQKKVESSWSRAPCAPRLDRQCRAPRLRHATPRLASPPPPEPHVHWIARRLGRRRLRRSTLRTGLACAALAGPHRRSHPTDDHVACRAITRRLKVLKKCACAVLLHIKVDKTFTCTQPATTAGPESKTSESIPASNSACSRPGCRLRGHAGRPSADSTVLAHH